MSSQTTIPTSATPDVVSPAILIDGSEVPGTITFSSIIVEREVNRIPSARLHIQDGDAASQTFPVSNLDLFAPGKEIEIQLGYRSRNDSVFKGVVVRQALKVRQSDSLLIVDCKDKAVRMTHGARSHYFMDQTDSDVMEEIIDGHGLVSDIEPTTITHQSLVQFDSTDWDFLVCRAEANGRIVVVRDGAVSISKPDPLAEPPVSVAFGSTLMELDIEVDARQQDESITAGAWDQSDQTQQEAEASEPVAGTNGNLSAEDLSSVLAAGSRELKHGADIPEPELQAWADARLLKQRLARTRGRATFQGYPGINPGDMITLDGIGERFEGTVFVSGIRHTVAQGQWCTDVQIGLDPQMFADRYAVGTMPASGLLPAAPGLQIGIITALEGDPDGEDRIRVKLPFVSSEKDGTWARLATLDAGKDRGTFFRPEVDDEVVVGFLHGDPRHAVILGQLHSSAKPTPEPLSDQNHRKGYISREKLMLLLDDDKKILHLETPAGNILTLSEDDKTILLQDQNGNKLAMSSDGVVIESIKDIKLKAAGDVTIEGVNIELKASAEFTAKGSTAKLTSASTTVEGSGTLTVKGGIVQIN